MYEGKNKTLISMGTCGGVHFAVSSCKRTHILNCMTMCINFYDQCVNNWHLYMTIMYFFITTM